MTTTDEVKSFLKDRFKPKLAKLGIGELTDDFSLTESGLVDSFGLLQLIMAVQDRFGIHIDVSEVDPDVVTTFGGFAQTVVDNAA